MLSAQEIQTPADPVRRRRLGLPIRLAAAMGAIVLTMLVVRSSVLEWNDVPSSSMRPTILAGDRIVVSKLAYDLRDPLLGAVLWHRAVPARGDLVVYRTDDGSRRVKRVVGLPGDLVESNGSHLRVNGADLPTGPHGGLTAAGTRAHEPFGPLLVPAGRLFLLGDDLSGSLDSRQLGTVRAEDVVGRAVAVAFSRDPETGRFREERFLRRLR